MHRTVRVANRMESSGTRRKFKYFQARNLDDLRHNDLSSSQFLVIFISTENYFRSLHRKYRSVTLERTNAKE